MGWSYAIDKHVGRMEIIQQQVNGFMRQDNQWGYVAHKAVGNHLWFVLERRDNGVREPCLVRMQSGRPTHGWGYKSESHLDAVDIPMTLLDLIPVQGMSETDRQWREAVIAHHKKLEQDQHTWKTLQSGDVIQIGQETYRYVERFDLGDQIVIARVTDGRHFRLDRANWPEATLTRKATPQSAPVVRDLFELAD